ncbi:hypothetical protein D3C77_612040 [compost metagenome]
MGVAEHCQGEVGVVADHRFGGLFVQFRCARGGLGLAGSRRSGGLLGGFLVLAAAGKRDGNGQQGRGGPGGGA